MKTPTLVVEGAQTPAFFSEIDKVVLSCIDGSRLVKIPDASHPMSAENPAAFNEAVLEFIAKRSPPPRKPRRRKLSAEAEAGHYGAGCLTVSLVDTLNTRRFEYVAIVSM